MLNVEVSHLRINHKQECIFIVEFILYNSSIITFLIFQIIDFFLSGPIFKLIKIHSPMRADPNRVVKWVPSHHIIRAARIASEKLLR